MIEAMKSTIDSMTFWASGGFKSSTVKLSENQTFISQGDPAEFVFYLQSGCAKRMVTAKDGEATTTALLAAGEFAGEEALECKGARYKASVVSMGESSVLKIEREEMMRMMRKDPSLSAIWTRFIAERGMRLQSDLVNQIFNTPEKWLAKILLPMA